MKRFLAFRMIRVVLLLQCISFILLLLPGFVSAGSVTYQYDARHRLTGATYDNGVTVAYTYDAAGNRLTETITANDAAASSSTKLAMALQKNVEANNIFGNYPPPPLAQAASITKTALGFVKTMTIANKRISYTDFHHVIDVPIVAAVQHYKMAVLWSGKSD